MERSTTASVLTRLPLTPLLYFVKYKVLGPATTAA
jgi:hypothetical protein